ncbi:MAG: hypothetical protein NTU62_13590, partial [Spirochaetes bacterium]|nr:hypothetical protein [Spirochaetota bacterium]
MNFLLYFSHDCDAYNHPKFVTLRSHYGGEKGRAMEQRFWQLNGIIGRAEGCRLDIRPEYAKPALAQKMDLSAEGLEEFLSFLSDPAQCDLIESRDGFLTTDRCQEELASMLAFREKDRNRKDSTGKPEYSNGKDLENPSYPDISSGKQGFSRQEGKAGKEYKGKEAGSAQSATPPAAAGLSVTALKKRLSDASILTSPSELEAIAAELVARSVDCDAFLTWALAKAAKA